MEKVPTSIQPYSPTEILFGFNDGEKYVVPYLELRYLCPCANCVDEHTGKRVVRREMLAGDVRPLNIEVVGRYAVQLTWSDGHRTGIYPYDRLFEISKSSGKPVHAETQ